MATSKQAVPIPITFLLGSFDLAGTPRHVLRLVGAIDRRRVRPSVCCFVKQGPLLPQMEATGVPTYDLGSPTIRRPVAFSRSLVRLWRVLRAERPQILHNYLFPANFFGSLVGRLAGVPVVLTTRRCEDDLEPRRRILLYRLTNPLVTRVVSVSARVTQSVIRHERLAEDRIVTILNGIEMREPSPEIADSSPPIDINGAPVIGTVSNLKPVKGLDVLIRAVARLRGEFPRLACVIVGEGELERELRELAASLGVAESVVFAGRREDIPETLSRFDVFSMTSLTEGISNSILEAMAAGLPVVATRVGGNEEIVWHGENGALVPPGDADAVADAIAGILRDAELRGRMGRRSRQLVETRFSVERMARDYEAFYSALVTGRG